MSPSFALGTPYTFNGGEEFKVCFYEGRELDGGSRVIMVEVCAASVQIALFFQRAIASEKQWHPLADDSRSLGK